MKKLAVLCLALLGAATLLVGTAPSASAYPDLTCHVDVTRQVLRPGDTFTVIGTAKVTGTQDTAVTWAFSWNGTTKHRTGSEVRATFTAPQVSHTRTIPLTARAHTSLGPCVHHFDIKVLGTSVSAPGGGGHLPSTGGPAFWLLVAALVLLLAGGTVLAARKRH